MTNSKSNKRPWWMQMIRALLWVITSVACVMLFVTGYAGQLMPSEYTGVAILVMVFPFVLLSVIFIGVIDAFLCRMALALVIVSLLGCLAPIWDFTPLNVVRPRADAADRTFTLLTYNVSNFTDLTGEYPGGINPTISYILRTNADVVNLQEVPFVGSNPTTHTTRAQMDSLYRAYPYIVMAARSQALLSKYPATIVDTGTPVTKGLNDIAVFRLNIEGEQITLIDVHLEPYHLSAHDKSLYRELTDIAGTDKARLAEVRRQLLNKIQRSAMARENDAHRIGRYINRFGGPNVIVAGDFNDVPGSYVLKYLAGFGMHETYPHVGFGPMITFNSDRFYFRIDHVLYRGALEPLSMTRGDIRNSDHYPLLTTFKLTD